MKTVIAVTAFSLIILIIVLLLAYVMAGKRKKAVQLYQAAAMQEGKGNYIEAIKLFETYLIENGNNTGDALSIEQRIKTLRSLIMPVIPA